MSDQDNILLAELNKKTYKEQAVWFLNAFWENGPNLSEGDNAENVWTSCHLCEELDIEKGTDGFELDEFQAHRLLEKIDSVLTVKEMRDVLRKVDLDFNGKVSLTEFLVYQHRVDWHKLVHAPQGEVDQVKLNLAEQKCEQAKADIEKAEVKAGEARIAEKDSVHAEMHAKEEESKALSAEEEAVKSAQEAVDAEEIAKKNENKAIEEEAEAFREESLAKAAEAKALEAKLEQEAIELQVKESYEIVLREEQAFKSKCDQLRATSEDPANGVVARNTAKNELAQLEVSDPLPLQRAKISEEACVRRQQRATRSAVQAASAAQSARHNAEESRHVAEKARVQATESAGQATSRRRHAEDVQNKAVIARQEAVVSRQQAEHARKESEKARIQSEEALAQSVISFQEAEAYLEVVKKECSGSGRGKLWWMDRELTEAKKYMSPAQLRKLGASEISCA